MGSAMGSAIGPAIGPIIPSVRWRANAPAVRSIPASAIRSARGSIHRSILPSAGRYARHGSPVDHTVRAGSVAARARGRVRCPTPRRTRCRTRVPVDGAFVPRRPMSQPSDTDLDRWLAEHGPRRAPRFAMLEPRLELVRRLRQRGASFETLRAILRSQSVEVSETTLRRFCLDVLGEPPVRPTRSSGRTRTRHHAPIPVPSPAVSQDADPAGATSPPPASVPTPAEPVEDLPSRPRGPRVARVRMMEPSSSSPSTPPTSPIP